MPLRQFGPKERAEIRTGPRYVNLCEGYRTAQDKWGRSLWIGQDVNRRIAWSAIYGLEILDEDVYLAILFHRLSEQHRLKQRAALSMRVHDDDRW